ncbi:MAG: hypothetical protein HQ572_05085, partial [Candidatus Omnitrophica bacterium]|nr:hypothetical protein [Candidatus Omnitrophota bacterium]
MKNQVVKNLGAHYIAKLMGMLLGLFLIPFLVRKLGKDAFGLIIITESVIAFFQIATISLRISLSRHATFALAQGNKDNFVELQWGATSIRWPDPVKFRDALGTYTDVTYKALLHDMEDGEDSQQVRGLLCYFLQILKEEETADKME